MEAEEADDDAFTVRIDAAIKKRSGTSELLAAAVVNTVEAIMKIDSTEQEAKVSQKAAKLLFIMKRISLKQKKVTVEG